MSIGLCMKNAKYARYIETTLGNVPGNKRFSKRQF